jgi:hypothetical protein
MVLALKRIYFPTGTNGQIECKGKIICNTIELPWRNNESRVSCIPEGTYLLEKRYSKKFQWHIEITQVRNRGAILFHPANNALKELNGCIAPVTKISGAGLGLLSRKAFAKLKTLVYQELDKGKKVLIIIKS